MEHIERSHPLRVTLSQIVVHCYHMNTITCKCIQEHREGSHKGLTFTSDHLGNLTLMENDTSKQLYIVVYHLPFQVITSCCPVVMIYGLVSIDGDKVLFRISGQFSIKVCGCDDRLFVLCETSCCLFYDSKHLGHHLIKCFLIDVKHLFLYLVDLCEDICTLIDRCILDLCLQLGNSVLLLSSRTLYLLL